MFSARHRMSQPPSITRLDQGLAAAHLQDCGRTLVLAIWEYADGAAGGRIEAAIDGKPVPAPFASIVLRTVWGGHRVVAALRRPAAGNFGTVSIREASGRVIAEARGAARLDAAGCDAAALMAGIDDAARIRLASFLLDQCRGVFRLGADAGYARCCLRLLQELTPNPQPLTPR